jgi:predicted nucleic acid-binding protein
MSWLAEVDEDEVFISVCTLAELRFGIATMRKGKRRGALDIWLRGDLPTRFDRRIVPIDIAIADVWGELGVRARKKGRSMGVMDGLLAATAVVYGMTVVTRNMKDFEAAGVELLNPWTR